MTGPAGSKGANGATGATGTGATGATGAKGIQGIEGESAFTNIVVRTKVVTGLLAGGQTVKCEPGEVAISGGSEAGDNNSKVYASVPITGEEPSNEGETPTGWLTAVENTGAKTTTFYVVCAS
jgi:hypothetical protein